MADELVDIVSFNNVVLRQEYKSVVHSQGLLHRACHLWIVRERPDGFFLVLQQRGLKKDLMSGYYDVAAAGHVAAGEEFETAMYRECFEELGIKTEPDSMVYAGRRIELYEDSKIKNFEICNIYLLQVERPLWEYQFAYPEVQGICEIELSVFKELVMGTVEKISVPGICCDPVCVKKETAVSLSRDSFIPRLDNYYEKMCEVITAFVSGRPFVRL